MPRPWAEQEELRRLASIGALNSMGELDRRGAMWEIERAARPAGLLSVGLDAAVKESPLERMQPHERLFHDFLGTGVTVCRHLMAHRRAELAPDVLCAVDLHAFRDNR